MRLLKIAVFWTFFMIMSVSGALAAVTVNDPSFDTTTVDVGTTRTVSVTMSTDSGTATISSFSVSASPSGLTVGTVETPFPAGTSGTTKTFAISSSTANTYSFTVTVIDSGGTSYSSGSATIEYVNPSSLTMNVLEEPLSSVYEGNNTGISINVINSLSSSQTRNLTIYQNKSGTFAVNASLGSDVATQLLSMAASQTRSVVWNLTIGSFSGTGHILIRLGDNTEAKAYTLTKSTAPGGSATTTTLGGGSSGSGGTTTTTASTTTTTLKTHEVQNVVKEIVNKYKEQLKTLLEQKEELQTGMRLAIGKELAPAIREAIAATSEKVIRNLNATKTIDVDLTAKVSKIEVKIKYNGTERVKNLIMLDVVPKSFANNSKYITVVAPSGVTINVTKADPEYLFTFPSLEPNSEKTVSYSVNERVYTASPEYSAPAFLAESVENVTVVGGNVTTTTVGGGLIDIGAGGSNLLIAVVVLLIAGGGAWYYYNKHGKKQPWQIPLRR